MREIWKLTEGIESLEVSNLGGVRTLDYLAPSKRALQPTQLRRGRVLIPDVGHNGYYRITIKRRGKVHRLYVHRLVAIAFAGGFFDKATVDHIDGNRLNNRADNLRWVSRAENTRLQNEAGRGVGKGEQHPSAKLKDTDIPLIFALRETGLSYDKIGVRFAVSGSLVHKVIQGKRRVHFRPE